MNAKYSSLVAGMACTALLLGSSSLLAAVAPPLGAVQSFAVFGGSGVTASGGAGTVVAGDVGSSPTSTIIGFPPALVAPGFTVHKVNDAVVQQARIDAFGAAGVYAALASQACDGAPIGATDLVGQTFNPGVHCFSSTVGNSGTMFLDGPGVYLFRVGSSLTTASSSNIVLLNGADSCSVFWQVVESATLGSSSTFNGNIFAQASVTLGTTASLDGRAVAGAAVTLDGSNIVGGCSGTAAAPTISKAFSPITIKAGGGAGGVSTLTITLSNPSGSVATLTAPLVDTLLGGLEVAATPNASTNCIGGTFATAPASGDTSVTLSAGAIPAGSSCTVTVDVSAPAAGSYVNTLAAGALETSNGSNAAPASASLTVNPATLIAGPVAPTFAKSFDPTTISANDPSTLTIILSNASSDTDVNPAAFTDNLPPGVVIVAGATSNTCNGSLTATVGTSIVSLSGGIVPFGSGTTPGTCTVTVPVTATAGGSFVNNLNSAVATLTVNPVAPTLSKSFTPSIIFAGGSSMTCPCAEPPPPGFVPTSLFEGGVSTLTITLSNPNTIDATGAALLDTLPAGMLIANPPNIINTCGGILTAAPGTGFIQLIGGTIPAGSGTTPGTCTVTVNVTTTTVGSFLNTLPVNSLQTSNGSNTVAGGSATLIAKSLPVPMLSGRALIMLTALLALVAFAAMRRHAI